MPKDHINWLACSASLDARVLATRISYQLMRFLMKVSEGNRFSGVRLSAESRIAESLKIKPPSTGNGFTDSGRLLSHLLGWTTPII